MRRWAILIGVVATALWAAAPAEAAGPTIPKRELRAIRVLLRSFVPEAVGREHPGKAWDLATPTMRSATTRADWRQGSLPVFPFPVRTSTYGIRPITVGPNDVTFDLMLHPRPGSNSGVEVYTTEVRRIDGRWLVDSMAASAQFAGPGQPATITAQPDFAPHIQGIAHHNNVSGKWVLVPIVVISLPLIAAPLGILLLWRRSRAPRPDAEARERAFAPWR